jgi:hypothetical protein
VVVTPAEKHALALEKAADAMRVEAEHWSLVVEGVELYFESVVKDEEVERAEVAAGQVGAVFSRCARVLSPPETSFARACLGEGETEKGNGGAPRTSADPKMSYSNLDGKTTAGRVRAASMTVVRGRAITDSPLVGAAARSAAAAADSSMAAARGVALSWWAIGTEAEEERSSGRNGKLGSINQTVEGEGYQQRELRRDLVKLLQRCTKAVETLKEQGGDNGEENSGDRVESLSVVAEEESEEEDGEEVDTEVEGRDENMHSAADTEHSTKRRQPNPRRTETTKTSLNLLEMMREVAADSDNGNHYRNRASSTATTSQSQLKPPLQSSDSRLSSSVGPSNNSKAADASINSTPVESQQEVQRLEFELSQLKELLKEQQTRHAQELRARPTTQVEVEVVEGPSSAAVLKPATPLAAPLLLKDDPAFAKYFKVTLMLTLIL